MRWLLRCFEPLYAHRAHSVIAPKASAPGRRHALSFVGISTLQREGNYNNKLDPACCSGFGALVAVLLRSSTCKASMLSCLVQKLNQAIKAAQCGGAAEHANVQLTLRRQTVTETMKLKTSGMELSYNTMQHILNLAQCKDTD